MSEVDYGNGLVSLGMGAWNRGRDHEKKRIVEYLNERIRTHFGCHGLLSTCERCIGTRQIIAFVEDKPE